MIPIVSVGSLVLAPSLPAAVVPAALAAPAVDAVGRLDPVLALVLVVDALLVEAAALVVLLEPLEDELLLPQPATTQASALTANAANLPRHRIDSIPGPSAFSLS